MLWGEMSGCGFGDVRVWSIDQRRSGGCGYDCDGDGGSGRLVGVE